MICLFPRSRKDPELKKVFDFLVQYWPAKKSNSKSFEGDSPEDPPAETDQDAKKPEEKEEEDSQEWAQVEDSQLETRHRAVDPEDGPPCAHDDYMSGSSTPPAVHVNEENELLAWTLGGDMRMTQSPGSPWAKTSMEDLSKASDPVPGSDEWISQRLAELEFLGTYSSSS